VERLPEDLRRARWVLREREEYLEKARREADEIVESARVRAEARVQRTEIVREAKRLAQRTVDEAREDGRRRRHEADDYCDRQLAKFQIVLERTARTVQAGREKLQGPPPPEEEPRDGDPALPDRLVEDAFFDQDR
ncbi:MAG: cell division initiation protein, partial [Acidimicrobiales bacterium]